MKVDLISFLTIIEFNQRHRLCPGRKVGLRQSLCHIIAKAKKSDDIFIGRRLP